MGLFLIVRAFGSWDRCWQRWAPYMVRGWFSIRVNTARIPSPSFSKHYTGSYSDWHPPSMAWLWGQCIALSGTITSMMTLHSVVLAVGGVTWAFAIWKAGARKSCILIPVLIASRVVVCYAVVVWKDVGFAFCMF